MRISDWSSDVCSSDLTNTARSDADLHRVHASFNQVSYPLGSSDVAADDLSFFVSLAQIGNGLQRRSVLAVGAIGRASCRDRVCQYVSISGVDVSLKKKQKQ